MREVVVASLGLDKTTGAPVVILREKSGERLLPIWIGPGEASAIAMQLAGVEFARPLTHDLFNAVVRGLGSTFVRVLVTKVVDNTYYASLVFRRDDEYISIDARPSDGIALALAPGSRSMPPRDSSKRPRSRSRRRVSRKERRPLPTPDPKAPPRSPCAIISRAGPGGLRPLRALRGTGAGVSCASPITRLILAATLGHGGANGSR